MGHAEIMWPTRLLIEGVCVPLATWLVWVPRGAQAKVALSRRVVAGFAAEDDTERMRSEPALRSVEGGRRDTLARAARILVAWVLIVGIQVLVGKMLVGPLRGSVGVGDNNAERWLARQRTGTLTDVARVLTLLGDTWTVIILAPVLLPITWLWLREVRAVVFLATAIVGEVAAYLVTVRLVSRLRPPVRLLDPGLDLRHSYPSGQVAASLAMYGGPALLILVYGRSRLRAWSVGLLVTAAHPRSRKAVPGRAPPQRCGRQPDLHVGLARGRRQDCADHRRSEAAHTC